MAELVCITEECGRLFVQSPKSKSLRCPTCRGERDRARAAAQDRVDPVFQALCLGRIHELEGLLHGGTDYE